MYVNMYTHVRLKNKIRSVRTQRTMLTTDDFGFSPCRRRPGWRSGTVHSRLWGWTATSHRAGWLIAAAAIVPQRSRPWFTDHVWKTATFCRPWRWPGLTLRGYWLTLTFRVWRNRDVTVKGFPSGGNNKERAVPGLTLGGYWLNLTLTLTHRTLFSKKW